MNRGDSEGAIYWAKRAEKYEKKNNARYHTGPEPIQVDGSYLVFAYELNGDYEKSLARLRRYDNSNPQDDTVQARLYYKLDRREDAFRAYCRYLQHYVKKMTYATPEERQAFIKHFQKKIMCEEDKETKFLCPFKDYREFHEFMFEMYEKIPDREKYNDAMNMLKVGWKDANASE